MIGPVRRGRQLRRAADYSPSGPGRGGADAGIALEGGDNVAHKSPGMKISTPKWPAALTRRRTLLLGGAGAATLAGAILASSRGGSAGKLLAGIRLDDLKDLGDGFYEADGWVLTADDVRRLGGRLPARPAD